MPPKLSSDQRRYIRRMEASITPAQRVRWLVNVFERLSGDGSEVGDGAVSQACQLALEALAPRYNVGS